MGSIGWPSPHRRTCDAPRPRHRRFCFPRIARQARHPALNACTRLSLPYAASVNAALTGDGQARQSRNVAPSAAGMAARQRSVRREAAASACVKYEKREGRAIVAKASRLRRHHQQADAACDRKVQWRRPGLRHRASRVIASAQASARLPRRTKARGQKAVKWTKHQHAVHHVRSARTRSCDRVRARIR